MSLSTRDKSSSKRDLYFPGEDDESAYGFDADPNDDGVINGEHFITATDPHDSNPSATRPTIATGDGTIIFTFRHSDRVAFAASETRRDPEAVLPRPRQP
jgi:hypothetical protein